jgi:hypothetical protein
MHWIRMRNQLLILVAVQKVMREGTRKQKADINRLVTRVRNATPFELVKLALADDQLTHLLAREQLSMRFGKKPRKTNSPTSKAVSKSAAKRSRVKSAHK